MKRQNLGLVGAFAIALTLGGGAPSHASAIDTTTTLPAMGACCGMLEGCFTMSASGCADLLGSYQGDGSSCTEPGICATPTTSTTLPPPTSTTTLPPPTSTTTLPPPTSTTTLPPTGACCAFGDCSVTTASFCEVGTYKGDGTTCTPGICSVCGNGIVESGEGCDDGNTAGSDGCSATCTVETCYTCSVPTSTTIGTITGFLGGGGPSVCIPDNGASCDDGDECTVNDDCQGGVCGGDAVLIPAACRWVIVGGDPSKDVQSRGRGNGFVTGDICGDSVRIGEVTDVTGDIVGTRTTGNAVLFSSAASVEGDVVTGGGVVIGKPHGTPLPGLGTQDTVATGMTVPQTGDPTSIYDTTGTDPRVAECAAAQAGIDTGAAAVAGLSQTEDRGDVLVPGTQSLTINATNVGGLNVIDFKRLRTGNDTTITLDGGGSPNTVFVLRIQRKFDIHFKSDLMLVNGTTPNHVIIYGQSKCKFGDEVTGGGTVICPAGKLLLGVSDVWNGALLGGKAKVQFLHASDITHAPLLVGP
jgi:cysteine-rich repeat protein